MNKLLPLLICLSILPAARADDVRAAIVNADTGLNAAISANDPAGAAAFYHDEFVLTTSAGTRKSKADMLAEIGRPDLKLLVNETTQVKVRVAGSTAVLTGVLHQKGSYKGRDFDSFLLVTDTWTNSGSRWLLLAGQASVISAEKASAIAP